MSAPQQTESSASNPLPVDLVCAHCAGIASHETWCITCNAIVRYAYAAAMDGGHLTLGDELSLHALGVEWTAEASREETRKQ